MFPLVNLTTVDQYFMSLEGAWSQWLKLHPDMTLSLAELLKQVMTAVEKFHVTCIANIQSVAHVGMSNWEMWLDCSWTFVFLLLTRIFVCVFLFILTSA